MQCSDADDLIQQNLCMYKTLAKSIGKMSVSALSNLYVVHINIFSLLKNFDKLKLFFNQLPRQVDIICLIDWCIFILLSRESDGALYFWTNPHPLRS